MEYQDATADGTQVLFTTRVRADSADDTDDELPDIYRRAGGETTLVTPDSGRRRVDFVGSRRVRHLGRRERASTSSTDGGPRGRRRGRHCEDFYELSGDDVRLLTPGTALTEFDAMRYEGRTSGGTHIYFTTAGVGSYDADTDVERRRLRDDRRRADARSCRPGTEAAGRGFRGRLRRRHERRLDA